MPPEYKTTVSVRTCKVCGRHFNCRPIKGSSSNRICLRCLENAEKQPIKIRHKSMEENAAELNRQIRILTYENQKLARQNRVLEHELYYLKLGGKKDHHE